MYEMQWYFRDINLALVLSNDPLQIVSKMALIIFLGDIESKNILRALFRWFKE